MLPSLEDLLFYTVAEGEETLPVHKFIAVSSALLFLFPSPAFPLPCC